MAGRFLLQKFSGTSRSTSLLGAHASASATAAAPIIPRASASGDNVCHGAAVHSGMTIANNHLIKGYIARYLGTVLCSHNVAKTSWPTTGTPSVVINRVNPAFVDCVGVKRVLSSAASSNDGVSREAKWSPRVPNIAAHAAELNKTTNTIMGLFTFICISWIYLFESPSGGGTKGKTNKKVAITKVVD